MKSLNVSVTVHRGSGGLGGTYGRRFLAGSEMTRLGGGAFRPSATAAGGTALSPSRVGVVAQLPTPKVSRKQQDAVTDGIFIGGRLLPIRAAAKETTLPGGRDHLIRRYLRQRLFTRGGS